MLQRLVGETPLEKYVARILNSKARNYNSGLEGALRDLMQGGCQSGYIGELIYTVDTVKFYQRFKKEINTLLYELLDDVGCTLPELLKDFEKKDPLVLEDHNQNLLAWFGFEETALRLCQNIGIEY